MHAQNCLFLALNAQISLTAIWISTRKLYFSSAAAAWLISRRSRQALVADHLPLHRIAVLEFDKCPARLGILLFESGQRPGQYVHPWPRRRFKVTRPAAAARQAGAEMNETYGMSTSEGISQVLRITQSEINILTYPRLCKSGYLIPTYPWICKSKHLIPSHPISIYKIYAWISRDILTFPGCCFSRCYEAARPSFFLGFREIREKRSHWPGGQSAPSCQARQPKISLHLDTTSWQFNLALKHHLLGDSNCCIWFSFTLGLQCHAQVTRLRQMFEMSHADLKQWRAQPPHFIRSGQHLRGQHFVYLLL